MITIGGWATIIIFGLMILGITVGFASEADSSTGRVIAILIGLILIIALFFGVRWYFTGTEAGQRAVKTQESNLSGGLYRTVTVYSYSGDEIRSWTGKFDVTENDQETWFDIDGHRVIIQGGIIINEEQEDSK